MPNDLISIIVPVYKVEPYLNKCVDSIINQTYKNIEIILVDDGSPDNCPKICDKYALLDQRIRVIHKENGGLSSARNAGISIATGEYIGFVDSDDYIAPTMYETLYKILKENNADLAICNFSNVDEFGNALKKHPSPIISEVLTQHEAYEKLFLPGYWHYVTAWNKLYPKRIFDYVHFLNDRIHEDEFLIHHLLGLCQTVVTTHASLYYYVQRDESIMTQVFRPRRLDGVDAMLDRYAYFKNRKYHDFAYHSLRNAYGLICHYLTIPQAVSYPSEVTRSFLRVMKTLIHSFEPRASKLLLHYFRYRIKCIKQKFTR